MIRKHLAILICSAVFAACGGGGGDGMVPAACSVSAEKNFVRDATNEWYLFPDLLPARVNPSDFATAQDLLDFMTAEARAQGKDRYFSYVTTKEEDSSFLQEGEFIGFGFRFAVDPVAQRAFFMDVYETSPASEAGLGRGDELLEVNSGSGWVPIPNLLATDPTLSNAFGPAEVGVQRGFRFRKVGTNTFVESSLTKRVVAIQPIPDDGVQVIPMPGNPAMEVGYVNLRTYISTADPQLRSAFGQFAGRGIQNVIVDLRYNGGGLISIAALVGDLLGALRQPDDVFTHIRFRASKADDFDQTRNFSPIEGTSVDAVNIAFITTGASASASEMTINGMKPWANVAIVGSDTYGKPVGQSAFDLDDRCETRLRLVTLRATNADEEGDYYGGLAETLPGAACAAQDGLLRPMGDPLEASTAAALFWLGTGNCSSLMSGVAAAQKPSLAQRLTYPVPERPTPAQVYLPGLY